MTRTIPPKNPIPPAKAPTAASNAHIATGYPGQGSNATDKDANCADLTFWSLMVITSPNGAWCSSDLPADPSPIGSVQAGFTVTEPGQCQVSGGEPTGEVTPTYPQTFCCQPSQ